MAARRQQDLDRLRQANTKEFGQHITKQVQWRRLRKKKAHNKAICAVARKLVVLIWQMLTKDQPYSWAPPLRTHEKVRYLEIIAGKPKHKSGPQPQYEKLIQLREKSATGG